MKSPATIQKLFPFLLLIMVLGVVFATDMEAQANSMLPNTNGHYAASNISPLPTPIPTDEPTAIPTDDPTPEPTDIPSSPTPIHTPPVESVALTFEGPSTATLNETFRVNVIAQNVSDPGLYGVQFKINYDSGKVSVSNLQSNANLSFVVRDDIDNTAGLVSFAASQQGRVPGLTGDVVLLSFDATAIDAGVVTFTLDDVKFSDSEAQAFDVMSDDYAVTLQQGTATPVPTVEPTAEPTSTPKPTSEPTTEPTSQPTPEPTVEPTSEPTVEPTSEPTTEPTSEPTVEPTSEPTPEPTGEPTSEPTNADLSGQIILAGRAGNNWSGATAKINSVEQTAISNANGNFEIADVPTGLHTISTDAPGYLSAVCSDVTVTAPQMVLAPVSLLAGDINDDDMVDIVDATIVGTSFGQTGSDVPADITLDEIVDIFDIVLVSVNYGEAGPKVWDCTGP